jgi:hypothetical protein
MVRAVVPQGVERWGPFEDPGLQRWYAQRTKGGESPHLSILALILAAEEREGENDQCRFIGGDVGWQGAKEGGGVHRSS